MASRFGGVALVVVLSLALCEAVCDWETCHECITDPGLCVWCPSEILDDRIHSRCRPETGTLKDNWCRAQDIQNPRNNLNATETNDFSSTMDHVVQIKPQRYHLDLRVGQTQKFTFSYKASANFPVDIYFLMDASRTMATVKESLYKQSHKIFQTMSSLTKNVYMGLGTFIDKNMVPYHFNIIANESYSFKHHLCLTSDVTEFMEAVKNLHFGTNNDVLEGGLDGIAQAIKCKKQIKWREQSRKILVYMADGGYHAAGDGRAAGIVEPYDGKCYLDSNGFYSKEKVMDYPSVGMINKMASQEQIKILFITKSADEPYNRLSSAIMQSETKNLPANIASSNAISDVLKEIYEGITQTLKLKVNLTAIENNYFDIIFEPNCDELLSDKEACTVSVGVEKNFTGKILLKQYFNKDRTSIGINPVGLKEEIVLDVNVISNCDCSKNAEWSDKCHLAGYWSCGVCECVGDNFGPTCGCSGGRNSLDCSPSNSTQVCSDHGNCNCGVCECGVGFMGKYCENQINNCQRDSDGSLCFGHGSCLNGQCICNSGWSGPACDCTDSTEGCINEGTECSNRGHCKCGACACNTQQKWDGRFQNKQNCSLAYNHDRQCRHLASCVNCLYKEDACAGTCGSTLIYLQNVSSVPNDLESRWNVCSNIIVDGFGCYSNFKYIYNDNDTMTLVVIGRNCAMSQIYIGVISLVVLLAVGIATLVAWKLLTDARDRREFEMFLKSCEGDDSEYVNPTYTAPCTTYLNPAFQNHCEDKGEDRPVASPRKHL